MHDQEDFAFPTNIKQIGSIADGLKIYMEDYVCTYLQQYAHTTDFEERIALLVGRHFVIDKQDVLFISGAIQGKYSKYEDNMQVFTDRTWEYAQEQMDLYFKGLEIIGWMYTQPGFGVFLNNNYVDFHMTNFTKPHNILFVVDPVEKVNSFYTWNEELNDLIESKGYIIYFDRNEGMHEYMLDNRIVKLKMQEELNSSPRHYEKTDKVIRMKRNETHKSRSEQRKIVNMLVSLTGVLLVVCFIMGTGLIQNEGRITALETELTAIDTSYNNLLAKIRPENVENVFASQDAAQPAEPVAEENQTVSAPVADGQAVAKPVAPTAAPVVAPAVVQPVVKQQPAEPPAATTAPTPHPVVLQPAIVQPKPAQQPATQVAKAPPQTTYTVQEGDSLGYISLKVYGTNAMMAKIMEANNLSDPDKIYIGKVLKMPSAS